MEWVYIAGLFDGEGCIQCIPVPHSYQVRLTLSQVDYRPIGFLEQRLGGTVRFRNGAGYHPRYDWGVYSRQAVRYILRGMRPYLVLKAGQADLVIRYRGSEALRQALMAAKKERLHQ